MVSPTTEKSKSHLSNINFALDSDPVFKTISMRSCDSLSIISYALMSGSLVGTLSRSNFIPNPPLSPISTAEQVNPAAPMS